MDLNEDFIELESPKLPLILRFCFFVDKLLKLPGMRQDGTLLCRRLTDLFAFKAPAQREPVGGVSSNENFIVSESPKLPLLLRLFVDKLLRLPAIRQDGTLLNRRLTDLFAFKAPPQREPVCGVSSDEDFIESESPKLPLILRFCFFADKLLRLPVMRQDGTVLNRRLTDLLAFKAPVQREPVSGVSSKDVVIGKGTGVWVRIYTPHKGSMAMTSSSMEEETTTKRVPIIFYFHGGGFAFLCADFTYFDAFCTRLCRNCAAVVISVDYKRSPEHRYPVAYDDCFSALKWLKSDGQEHIPTHVDISHCFLMGDSAGGNIVYHVTSMAAAAEGDLSPLKVIGSLLLFPFFGGEERTPSEMRLRDAPLSNLKGCDWCWKAYLPKTSNRDHPAANVVGPRAPDLTKLPLPPCMVVIAEFDPLKDWQLRYCEKLKQSGKEVQMEYYKGAIHAFHVFPQLMLGSTLLMTMHKFVQARCDVAIAGTTAA